MISAVTKLHFTRKSPKAKYPDCSKFVIDCFSSDFATFYPYYENFRLKSSIFSSTACLPEIVESFKNHPSIKKFFSL